MLLLLLQLFIIDIIAVVTAVLAACPEQAVWWNLRRLLAAHCPDMLQGNAMFHVLPCMHQQSVLCCPQGL